jgi:predicted  nucleic acid-binding Zn-ribbon protein
MVTLENSFGSNYPELLKDWDYELNLDSPFSYSSQSGKKVYWKCQKCAYKWEAVLASRVKGNGCSMCSGKIITSKNNLGDAFPELLKEWNYEKNIKSPFSYFSHSGKKVWWKCLKCGQEWDDVIYHRTDKNKMSGCPFCAGKRVSKENSLGSLYPELLLDWDYIKNSKSPYEYTAHSDKYIFWICHVCGYSWETMIDGRTRKEAGCPQCSWNNRKSAGMEEIKRRFSEKGFSIISNYNVKRVFDVVDIMDKDGYKYRTTLNSVSDHRKGSLEKFYKNSPFLFDNMLLWVKLNDADFDLLSYEITNNKKSTKVKLSCHECGDVWETNWNAVTSAKLGCPNCASSKGNKFIKKYLLKNGVDVIPEYRFSDCKGIKNRPMPFDFYLPDYNLTIEYQGQQHYFPVNFGGISDDEACKNFEELQIRDAIKEQYCLDHNIPLLRIHYKNFNRIPEILTSYLNL